MGQIGLQRDALRFCELKGPTEFERVDLCHFDAVGALEFLPWVFDFWGDHKAGTMKSGLTVLRLPRGWCVAPLGTDWSHRSFPFSLTIGDGKDSVLWFKLLMFIKKVLSLGVKWPSCKSGSFLALFPQSLTGPLGTPFSAL